MHHTLITNGERAKIVDAPLMPILIQGHGACCYLFSVSSRPILWLYIGTTISLWNYPTYKTKNRWCSVDTQIQNGAGSVRLTPLPIQPVITGFMNGLDWSPRRLPMMQNQRSLKLHGRSFCYGRMLNMVSINLADYIINGVLAVLVPSSCTFFFMNTWFFSTTYKYILRNTL